MSSGSKGAILIIDDENAIGQMLVSWLSDEGYEAIQVHGFAAAKAACTERSFDLVTLDINLPDVIGLQILAWFRQQYPDTGVIMATAMGDLDTVLAAVRGGAINYLLKPFDLALMSAEIEKAMVGQRQLAESRARQTELERRVQELEERERLSE